MTMQNYFADLHPQILQEISDQCRALKKSHLPNASEIADHLYEYTSRGKLLRASFVCLAAESFGRPIDKTVLKVAGAIELAQSALLIHDDIMDQDEIRRGKPSLHACYRHQLGAFSQEAIRTSESIALCIGDVALFHLFQYLASYPDLVVLFSHELSQTALGQAFEIEKAFDQKEISREEIEMIIQQKTARYTFVLPFLSGLILAEAKDRDKNLIQQFSFLAGMIFQIRDDSLNYFPESQTGKSSGGDIRENKKTLCRWILLQKAPEAKNLYGKEEHIDKIREMYFSLEVDQMIKEQLIHYSNDALKILNQCSLLPRYKHYWEDLLAYLLERNS